MARPRVLIDTDPGIDDAVAILLALASPEIDVVGITAVAGTDGTVWIDEIVTGAAPSRLKANHVWFAPGSRTAWHTHPVGQTLHVVQGLGLVQLAGQRPQVIRPGDTVWIAPQERHWHGAAPGKTMAHLAMQEAESRKWYRLAPPSGSAAAPPDRYLAVRGDEGLTFGELEPVLMAVAAGGITESLILAKNAAEGVNYQPGWILGTAATIKVFIDIFIGIWAFILGYIWTNHINVTKDKAKASEIWQRFPKFILGFVATFAVGLYLALGTPAAIAAKVPAAMGEANAFRVIFFILTFFSIGVLSNFRTLWQEGIGKLAAVYVISLFGFVIWVGLLISWLFFSGIHPPLAS